MTTTVTLGVPTLEDYDLKLRRIPVASLANFAISDGQTQKDNVSQAVYTYGAGDPADVLTLTCRRSYVEKTNVTNNSIRLSGLTKSVVSETGAVSYDPIEAVIAWNVTGKYSLDADFAVEMVSIAMSIFAQTLTGANGTPTSAVVDKFDHNTLTEIV